VTDDRDRRQSDVAWGVFLGLWLFVLSAALLGGLVAALLWRRLGL
jgi:hypothetical protein